MHWQACLVARTNPPAPPTPTQGGGFVGRGPPRPARRLSFHILSSPKKKEYGPRRAVDRLSGRYWLGEILKFCFEPGVVEYYLQLCFCVASIPQSRRCRASSLSSAWVRLSQSRFACVLGVSPIYKGAFGWCSAWSTQQNKHPPAKPGVFHMRA